MIHEDVWRPNPCQVAIDPVNNYTRHQIACLSAFSSAPSIPPSRPIRSHSHPTPHGGTRSFEGGRGRRRRSTLDGGDFFVGVRARRAFSTTAQERTEIRLAVCRFHSVSVSTVSPPNGDCPRRRPFGTGEGGGQRHRQRRPLAHCATDKCILGLRGSEKIEGFIRYLYSRPHSRMQQVKCRRIRFIRCR